MGLSSIKASQTLVLDSNILITAFNNPQSASGKLLESIKKIGPRVFISTLVFEEFLVRVYKKKLEKDIASYENFIAGGGAFIVVNIDRKIARRAAQIRANYSSIRAPDAIHLATAIESKAKIFVTCDKRLPKKIEKLSIEILS